MLTSVTISLILDYQLSLNWGKHWSIGVLIWSFALELILQDILKRRIVVAKTMTITMLLSSSLLCVTGWYFGFFQIVLYMAIPIIISTTILINLIFAFIDSKGNTLVYLLTNLLMGVIPYIVFDLTHDDHNMLPWTICLMITLAAFFSLVIFKGRNVLSEVQKRMNF